MSVASRYECDCTKYTFWTMEDGCRIFNVHTGGRCLCMAFRRKTAPVSNYTTIGGANENSGNQRPAWTKTE